jgi:hypothetical protein
VSIKKLNSFTPFLISNVTNKKEGLPPFLFFYKACLVFLLVGVILQSIYISNFKYSS